MAGLTADEASKLGAMLRNAREGNLLVGRFAAEMVGESYPFSMRMAAVVFQGHSDEVLGRRPDGVMRANTAVPRLAAVWLNRISMVTTFCLACRRSSGTWN